jgi:hypothetical protein
MPAQRARCRRESLHVEDWPAAINHFIHELIGEARYCGRSKRPSICGVNRSSAAAQSIFDAATRRFSEATASMGGAINI